MCMCILCATAKLFCLDARSADERRERERGRESTEERRFIMAVRLIEAPKRLVSGRPGTD